MAAPEQPLVWGTGYGSKRHLVAEGTRKDQSTRRYGRERYAQAACSTEIHLSFFADDPVKQDEVMSKGVCNQCAKKAGLKDCGTCSGTGKVPA